MTLQYKDYPQFSRVLFFLEQNRTKMHEDTLHKITCSRPPPSNKTICLMSMCTVHLPTTTPLLLLRPFSYHKDIYLRGRQTERTGAWKRTERHASMLYIHVRSAQNLHFCTPMMGLGDNDIRAGLTEYNQYLPYIGYNSIPRILDMGMKPGQTSIFYEKRSAFNTER